MQQVQHVAKKLESMLETALSQLKTEQKKRKESENRLMELELDVVNKEHEIKVLENKLDEVTKEKDEKICSLESSVNFLQSVIIEKEQEILRLQELTEEIEASEGIKGASENLNQTLEKYELKFNKLLENSSEADINALQYSDESNDHHNIADVDTADTIGIDNDDDNNDHEELTLVEDDTNEDNEAENIDVDGEEYILDESMEELQNEENNIAEITEEAIEITQETLDIKEEIETKPVAKEPTNSKQCGVCGEIFTTKGKLKQHQKEMEHEPRYECELCGKFFKTKGTKVAHKARIHSDVMPYKCSKCDKRFKDQGSCRRHEANDSVHIRNENIKHNPNLLCNICGKEFDRNRRWCLDQHYLVHLSSKKFGCDICSHSYRKESLLKEHKKLHVTLNTP